MTDDTTAAVLAELVGLDDSKLREVNRRHGDDHGVKLSDLRALAKRLKVQPDLARDPGPPGIRPPGCCRS